jgi:hypothetical protein
MNGDIMEGGVLTTGLGTVTGPKEGSSFLQELKLRMINAFAISTVDNMRFIF